MTKINRKKDVLNFFVEMAKEQLNHEPMSHLELIDFLVDSGCEEKMSKEVADIFDHLTKE